CVHVLFYVMTDLTMLHVIFERATNDHLDEKVTHLLRLESIDGVAQYPALPVITHKPLPPARTSKHHPLKWRIHRHLSHAIENASLRCAHSLKIQHANSIRLVARFFPGIAYFAPHRRFGISLLA